MCCAFRTRKIETLETLSAKRVNGFGKQTQARANPGMALAQRGVCRQGFSMVTHPAQLFTLLLLGIVSLGLLAGALYLLWKTFKPRVQYTERVDPADERGTLVVTRRERPGKRLMIAAALTMLVFVFAGRY